MIPFIRTSQNYSKLQHSYLRRQFHGSNTLLSAAKKSKEPENLSFIHGIFRGHVEPREIFPFPTVLTQEQSETVRMLVDPMAKFFQEQVNAEKNETLGKMEDKVADGLWAMGVFGLQVPTDLGGLGLSNTECTRLIEIVGGHDLAMAITIGAHQSIGFKGILLFGNPEQKKKYLPQVSSGKKYASFCLTEPTAGSDANSIRTRAVLSPDGKHYVLNGSKIWITNGGFSEIMTVFAQTPVTSKKSGKTVDKMTAFIVERAFGGVTSGPPEKKMGIHASNTTELFFEDCKVPLENVLGGVGNGFKVAMNILNNGRFGLVAGLAGNMKTCTRKAVEFATSRKQFGKTIDNYGMIQEKIARMAMLQYVTESLAYMLSGNMDRGSTNYHLEAAICKCFASEAGWTVCDEAMQIMGGMGYMKHSGLEKNLRDLRIFRTFEGSNEILRLLVALSGIRYVGTQLKELQAAFKNPLGNLSTIFGAVKDRAIKKLKSPPPTLKPHVHPELADSAALISKAIDKFGDAIEAILVRHGKGIIEEQFILFRIANSVMDIYTSGVILSRASKSLREKIPSASYEKQITQVWCRESYQRVRQNLRMIVPKKSPTFDVLSTISKKVCETGGIVQISPLNF